MENEIGSHAHLIVPKESRVECGAVILRKEVFEALEDIPALERFEKGQDNVEIARPAPTHARYRFGAHAGRLPVMVP